MVKHGKVSPSASVRTQHKKDGRGVLIVDSDGDGASAVDSSPDQHVRSKSSSSAKNRRKAERRAARKLAAQPQHDSAEEDPDAALQRMLDEEAAKSAIVSTDSGPCTRVLALPAGSGSADTPAPHSSLLVTPTCSVGPLPPPMAHHQDQQGPPEQNDPTSGSSASLAPGLGGSVDLAQLHVSLLQVVNQAITHTLQPVLSQQQQRLDHIDEGQRILQSKMSSGLASLSSSISHHGSRLSAVEEAQRSLSQRLRQMENAPLANPQQAATHKSTIQGDTDQDMGDGPPGRGRARSAGPERSRGQPINSRAPSEPPRRNDGERPAKPDWQKKLVVLKGFANRHTLQEFRAMLSSTLDVPDSARVFVRAKFDNKCQVACESVDDAKALIQSFIQTPRVVGEARIYANAFESPSDAKYNFWLREAKRHIIAQAGATGIPLVSLPMDGWSSPVSSLPRSPSKAFATPSVPRRLSVGNTLRPAAAWRSAGIEKRALDAPAVAATVARNFALGRGWGLPRIVSWNARALFHSDPYWRDQKMAHLCTLSKKADILCVQEAHVAEQGPKAMAGLDEDFF
eukprot:6490971-Amphidinium_carterae.1